ncbi:MAG TPA: TetR/AcrR family transcriptional regulator [Anaeromyxobacteraceae bacterium]|nr:TetR/AcrR family transcriptional regulator [Anaeromyxobacteraceae bacterium]
MSRVRADDYDDKRHGILDAAAVLFAREGYAHVKMVDIAGACGASKSMLYHYFTKKEDVLFEIMIEQVRSYLEATEATVALPLPPERRLHDLATMWMRKTTQARARITVLMYEYKFLPPRQRKLVDDVARKLIDRVADLVAELHPGSTPTGRVYHRTYALLLFGLLNWTEVWFRSTGPIGAEEMAEMIHGLFLYGLKAAAPAAKARPARA